MCWKHRLCFGNPLKGQEPQIWILTLEDKAVLSVPIYSTAGRQIHSANFLSNSKHIRKSASSERLQGHDLQGDKPGQLLSSPFPARAAPVSIQPQLCVSWATEAPPEHQGAQLQPAESFLCELLQHWGTGEKGMKIFFFQLQMNPQSKTNPFSHAS